VTIPVVADADTLFGATTRGLLVHLDYRGLIKLHWSPLILSEMSRALVDTKRKATLAEARSHEERLMAALPNAMVHTVDVQQQFPAVQPAVKSPKDIHVAACALHLLVAHAYPQTPLVVLVTRNTRDFRKGPLAKLGIDLQSPDDFLSALFASETPSFAQAFRSFRLDLRSKPTPESLLAALARDGQRQLTELMLAAHEDATAKL
jgi:hypothetical protein